MTADATQARRARVDPALRLEIEDFLYEEAAILDEWRLDDWAALFTEDARYIVPTTDLLDGDPRENVVFIDDDIVRIRARVVRLKSRHAHREYPSSRTRRLITNVRITSLSGDEIEATASFLVYRLRMGQVDPYMGRYLYRFRRMDGELKICYRRAELDLEALHDHGAVSIII